MNGPSFADPANLVVEPDPEFEGGTALGFLHAIYKSRMVPLSVRIRCAVEALPFESPKLTATALMTSDDFATLLDKAIERSNGARVINHRQHETENRE
jgi:hypothetical protein